MLCDIVKYIKVTRPYTYVCFHTQTQTFTKLNQYMRSAWLRVFFFTLLVGNSFTKTTIKATPYNAHRYWIWPDITEIIRSECTQSERTLLHELNIQFGFSRVAAAPQLHIVRSNSAHRGLKSKTSFKSRYSFIPILWIKNYKNIHSKIV